MCQSLKTGVICLIGLSKHSSMSYHEQLLLSCGGGRGGGRVGSGFGVGGGLHGHD